MKKYLFIMIIVLFTFNLKVIGQEYSDNSFTIGLGPGINEGLRETGMGGLVSIGYQRSFFNDRFRVNPNITTGNFFPFGITDTRDQYYRVTSLGVNCYLDAIKYRSLSLFIGAGGLVNYTRGLLGTGGWPEEGNTASEYLVKLYYGGYLAAGFRINPPEKRIAYELTPINICFGSEQFFMGYFKVGINIKLIKKNL
jgi:hypothetical protein